MINKSTHTKIVKWINGKNRPIVNFHVIIEEKVKGWREIEWTTYNDRPCRTSISRSQRTGA